MQILILFVLLVLLIIVLRSIFVGNRASPSKQKKLKENMLPCAYCGVHIPQSTAINTDGEIFCSKEHHHHWLEKQAND